MVVDWRAPISRPFYRASRPTPLGVRLRRRFGFHHGSRDGVRGRAARPAPTTPTRTGRADAAQRDPRGRDRAARASGRCATSSRRSSPSRTTSSGPTSPTTVCVQGAPGTGKTAVGLHRAAYLLYAHRDQLSRQGVLVVGPNDSFLRYIGDVLPALGEIDARQTTVEELVAHVPVQVRRHRSTCARSKGDARMAQVLERALWSQRARRRPRAWSCRSGARRWRVPAYEADEIVAELRPRGVRYGAGPRDAAAAARAHDPGQDGARRRLPRRPRAELGGPQPPGQAVRRRALARRRPERLVMRLLGEPGLPRRARRRHPDRRRAGALRWAKPAKGPGSARWSLHDAVLDRRGRRPARAHAEPRPRRPRRGAGPVADDAALASAGSARPARRRCSATSPRPPRRGRSAPGRRRSATSASRTPTSRSSRVGFRVPGDVIDYAARLLPPIAPTLSQADLGPPRPRRARHRAGRRPRSPRPSTQSHGARPARARSG